MKSSLRFIVVAAVVWLILSVVYLLLAYTATMRAPASMVDLLAATESAKAISRSIGTAIAIGIICLLYSVIRFAKWSWTHE